MNTIDTAVREAAEEIRRSAEALAGENAGLKAELEASEERVRAWHGAVQTASVLLGIPCGLSPREFLEETRRQAQERDELRERVKTAEQGVATIRSLLQTIAEFGRPMPIDARLPMLASEVYGELSDVYARLDETRQALRSAAYLLEVHSVGCRLDEHEVIAALAAASTVLASGDGEGR